MPVVPFDSLPDSARVWVFGAADALTPEAATALLAGVDAHLAEWKAHGTPLTVASQLRDERFLVVAVDQEQAGATGCSIDGLFRVLRDLEGAVGTSLVGGGRVFYRDHDGRVAATSREEVSGLLASGALTPDSVVFDTSLTDLGAFRATFERPAKDSWVASLLT